MRQRGVWGLEQASGICLESWPKSSLPPRKPHPSAPSLPSNLPESLPASGLQAFLSRTAAAALCPESSPMRAALRTRAPGAFCIFLPRPQTKTLRYYKEAPDLNARHPLGLTHPAKGHTELKSYFLSVEQVHKENPIHQRPEEYYQDRRDTMGSI